MSTPQSRLQGYINDHSIRVMQLATVSDSRPWVCSVYYVADEQGYLYWLSMPARRHSQELAANQLVAATIVVRADKPVVGVQISGTASMVDDAHIVAKVMERYVRKYQMGKQFYENFVAGKNQHSLYRLRPDTWALFDEHNSPDEPRQEWGLSDV